MGDNLRKLAIRCLSAALLVLAIGGAASAQQPRAWEMFFQEAASPVMQRIAEFNVYITVIIVLITVLVLALILAVIVRFNEKANPRPSKTTHNALLEVLWTAVPVIILVAIAIPSLRLLYFMDKTETPELTLKVIGHQWYWSYEYPDNGNFTFDSLLVPDDQLQPGQPRLLTVDNRVVLPVDTNIRLLITATDVIHSWALPALVEKIDAIPGRTNEGWVRIIKEGTFYGQCSELCGVNHGFMPVAVEAVSKEKFAAWVAEAQRKFANTEGAPLNLAQARTGR